MWPRGAGWGGAPGATAGPQCPRRAVHVHLGENALDDADDGAAARRILAHEHDPVGELRALGVEAAVVVERKLDEPAVGQPVLELRRRHLERLARRVVRRPRRADEEAGVGERAGERPVVAPRHLSWQSCLELLLFPTTRAT